MLLVEYSIFILTSGTSELMVHVLSFNLRETQYGWETFQNLKFLLCWYVVCMQLNMHFPNTNRIFAYTSPFPVQTRENTGTSPN